MCVFSCVICDGAAGCIGYGSVHYIFSGQKILQSQADLNHEGDKNLALAQLVQNIETKLRTRLRIPDHVTTPERRPRDAHMDEVPSPRYPHPKRINKQTAKPSGTEISRLTKSSLKSPSPAKQRLSLPVKQMSSQSPSPAKQRLSLPAKGGGNFLGLNVKTSVISTSRRFASRNERSPWALNKVCRHHFNCACAQI